MLFLEWSSSSLFFKTCQGELSCGLIWPHDSSRCSWWSLTNFRRACTCADLSMGRFPVMHDFKPWRHIYYCGPSSLQIIEMLIFSHQAAWKLLIIPFQLSTIWSLMSFDCLLVLSIVEVWNLTNVGWWKRVFLQPTCRLSADH